MASESPPPDPPTTTTTTTTTDSASLPEDAEDNNNTMVEVSSSELTALRAEAGEAHTLRSQLGISRTKVGELKAELTTLLEKLEAAESDAHWSKQRYDKMVERMAAEKEAAVTKLKERFREITHKQKQKFMQQQQAIGQERARVTKLQHERQGLVQKLSGADEREAALKERLVQQKAEFTDLREKVKVVQQAYAADKKKWRKEASKESKELEKQQAAVEELQNELEGKTKEIEEFARMERAKRQMQVFMESSSEAPCNGETIKLQVLCNTDYQVQWSRSFCGSRFNDIPGATSEKYLLTADDVGSCLRASCTSVETEHTVTSEIGPILLNPDLVDELKALEEQKEVIFALSPCPRPKKPVQKFILINREKIKIRNEKKKTIDKAEWNPHVNVTLDAVDNTKLLVQINERNISFTYLAESSKERDKIALAIRLFAVRKDIDDSHHLGFVVRYANEIHTQSQAEQQEAGFGVPAGLGASLAAAAAPEFSFSERPGSVRSMQSAGSGADEDDEDAPSNGATPVKKDAPPQKKEVQYDADGYIIRQDSNRGFAATAAPASAFGFDSSSDEEDSLSNRFKKVTIRDADDTAALDSSRLKSATILAPPSSGRGRRATIMAPPSSSKKSKKKSKRKKRNSVSGLPAAAAAAGDVAAGAPTVEVIDEVSPNDGADEEEDDDAAAPGPVRARRMSAPPRAGSTHRIKASPPPTLGTVSENGDDDDDATPPPVDEADPVASMQMHVTPPDQQEEDPDDPFFGVSPIPSPEVPPTPRAVKSSCSALVSVRESVHARFNSGVLSQVAVTGEIAVKLSAKPDVDTVVQLQLNNLGLLNAITPNKANTSSTAPGMYLVRVPAQSDSVVCLKYKVITGSSAASKAKLVPLNLNAQWAIEENVATIDVEYSFKEPFEALTLAKPRFLVEVSPQGAVKELVFSNPECLLNKSKTKFLWKLQQLPVPGDSTNKLHAKLSTVQECLPTPIKASFQIPDRTLSGIEISSVNEPPSVDGQFAVVAKVRRSIVAGTYTAQ